MKKKIEHSCSDCGKTGLPKNTVALNQKILGRELTQFYCMDCLAEFLEVTVEELEDKIQEFKNQGCKLFA